MRCCECGSRIEEVLLVADIHPLLGDLLFTVRLVEGKAVATDVEEDCGAEALKLFVRENVLALAQEYLDAGNFGDEDFMCPECESYLNAPWMQLAITEYLGGVARALREFDVSMISYLNAGLASPGGVSFTSLMQLATTEYLDGVARALREFDVSMIPLNSGEIRFVYDGASGDWKWE